MALVLVVDDEEQVRGFMKKAIATLGHDVEEAKNGIEALDLWKKLKPDLVVTDLLMPEKGGLSLITEMRRGKQDQKILAVSGGGKDGRMDFLSTAATVPGVKTLHKPFSIEELNGLVSSLLAD